MSVNLWRHRSFMRFWVAQSISVMGTAVTEFALPLTAGTILNATPAQMGILRAFQFLPFLGISLLVGVMVDRQRRRPILIAADLGRAVLLSLIPLAAILSWLRIELLYVIALLVGILTVGFDVADQSFLPVLVERDHLVEGNSKLQISNSLAEMIGPGIAGGLVAFMSAPLAIGVDVFSFLGSAALLGSIRVQENPSSPKASSIWREMHEGLMVVVGNPLLRPIVACTATSNLFGSMFFSLLILYATRDLQILPALLGSLLGLAGLGTLLGALLAGRIRSRFGLGMPIIGSHLISGGGQLLIALAGGSVLGILALAVGRLLIGTGYVIYNVNQVSLRQALIPDHLQGRLNATVRFIVWGTIPLGSLLGGLLGEWIGVRPTLILSSVGDVLSCLWVVFSPIRHLSAETNLSYQIDSSRSL